MNDGGTSMKQTVYRASAITCFIRGEFAYSNEDYDQAIAEYNMAIQHDPDYQEAFMGRGLAYAANGKYDQAIKSYNHAVELNALDAEIYYNRGLAYYNKGDASHAIADFGMALHLNPQDAVACYNRGLVYLENGLYDNAIADYDRAIELDPQDADIYHDRVLPILEKAIPSVPLPTSLRLSISTHAIRQLTIIAAWHMEKQAKLTVRLATSTGPSSWTRKTL
jgi:tetratricopeptide (TPR) repeat protein